MWVTTDGQNVRNEFIQSFIHLSQCNSDPRTAAGFEIFGWFNGRDFSCISTYVLLVG